MEYPLGRRERVPQMQTGPTRRQGDVPQTGRRRGILPLELILWPLPLELGLPELVGLRGMLVPPAQRSQPCIRTWLPPCRQRVCALAP